MAFSYTPTIEFNINTQLYATPTFASSYFSEARLNTTTSGCSWKDFSRQEQEALLQQATILLDNYDYKGTPQSATQRLKFPRSGIKDRLGNEVAENTMPIEMAIACCETALWLSSENRLSETYARAGTLDGVGSIHSYNNRAKQPIPRVAKQLIRTWRVGAGTFTRV